jgi:hypothetical protein
VCLTSRIFFLQLAARTHIKALAEGEITQPGTFLQIREVALFAKPWLSFAIQACLCFATIGAFGAALWYADIADKQRLSSDMQVGTLVHQVETAERANEITREAADSAERQSQKALDSSINIAQSDQRPWVESDLTILEPLTMVNGTSPNASVEIGINLYNTGHSPALNARVDSRLIEQPTIPPFINRSSKLYLHNTTMKTCAIAQNANALQATVFSGRPQDLPFPFRVNFNLSHYRALRQTSILLVLTTCIDYQFPGSSAHHQTAYLSFIGDLVDGVSRRVALINANLGQFSVIAPGNSKIVRISTPIAN